MEPISTISGIAAPLPMINVDTDKIIPGRFLKTIAKVGLADGLFEQLRLRPDGSLNPDFILNRDGYRDANILVAGDNFGCGSSREHAPWALLDYGIRCVIAPSFADIFHGNSLKTGLLPVRLPHHDVEHLMAEAALRPDPRFKIELAEQRVTSPSGRVIGFEVEPAVKHRLLKGLGEIESTLERTAQIVAFEAKHLRTSPWLRAGPGRSGQGGSPSG